MESGTAFAASGVAISFAAKRCLPKKRANRPACRKPAALPSRGKYTILTFGRTQILKIKISLQLLRNTLWFSTVSKFPLAKDACEYEKPPEVKVKF
jgi:hypothetical protein